MKFAIAAAALFTLATAQTLADIPSCAVSCLNDAVMSSSKCSTTDIPCVCQNIGAIQGASTSCVVKACGSDVAINKVLPAAKALCAAQGKATGSASGSSVPASTGKSSAPASSGPATSAPATTPSAMTTKVWSSVPCDTTMDVYMTPSGNQTNPTSVPIAAGAAGLSAGVAAIALAVLAL